jgi:hypothetical protein
MAAAVDGCCEIKKSKSKAHLFKIVSGGFHAVPDLSLPSHVGKNLDCRGRHLLAHHSSSLRLAILCENPAENLTVPFRHRPMRAHFGLETNLASASGECALLKCGPKRARRIV